MKTETQSTAISQFAFEGTEVRAQMKDGRPVWVARDACAALGISKYRDAIAQLDEDERVSISVDTLGGKQKVTAVTEEGVYGLLLIAPSEVAQAFRRWLKHVVLPALRRGEAVRVEKVQDWTRLRHQAAASYKVMSEALEDVRREAGKETARHHYSNEARLVNWACFGKFEAVNREELSREALDLLAAVERKNTLLIARAYDYDSRKALLARFAEEEKSRLGLKLLERAL